MSDYEKLGTFYLGRHHEPQVPAQDRPLLLYDAKDLVTHAVCVGMTGSGKTGLCVGLLEEAALDGIPALVIDPKGDLGNLLLTFPELRPEDFEPWVNEDDARRQDLTVAEFAARQANLWRDGLASWQQDGERIRRLRDAAEFAIYTPGSEAGLAVSVLSSFAAPAPEVVADGDLYRDRISTTVSSLLGLLGVAADPVRSREHILLSSLLDHFWKARRDADLAGLIQAIQAPPFRQVGVLELESFYPAKERFELAMLVNNLLAAPGFQGWTEGVPLDVDELLYTASGKPRVAIFSLAHLSDAERMFFVSLLLEQTLGWMRSRPGTDSLRAILYMDEIFGFIPPVAEPPSKRPLLTLLKQARAYGLGVVLATQNPVDLDYKGLSNTGTWFLGRLQTERDKERVLDGLEGSAASAIGFDRKRMDEVLSSLGKRVFLLHNVHEDGPALFETRWVMSYLRGPLTRSQIARLMGERKASGEAHAAAAPEPEIAAEAAPTPQIAGETAPPAPAPGSSSRPVVDPGVPEIFLPPATAGPAAAYAPRLLGLARIHYVDRRSKQTLHTEEPLLLLPLGEELLDIDWPDARAAELREEDLTREPAGVSDWLPLPAMAADPKSYAKWRRELADHLYRNRSLELFASPRFKQTSQPGESERDFRIRLADLAREERDRQVAKLRQRHAGKAATLEERIRRAQQKVEKEREQASQHKLQTAISVGATILSALTGRKKLSYSTLGRATTALRGAGRSADEKHDVERAEETVEALQDKLEKLNAELGAAIEEVGERLDAQAEELEGRSVRPRKSDIDVRLVALAWEPVAAA